MGKYVEPKMHFFGSFFDTLIRKQRIVMVDRILINEKCAYMLHNYPFDNNDIFLVNAREGYIQLATKLLLQHRVKVEGDKIIFEPREKVLEKLSKQEDKEQLDILLSMFDKRLDRFVKTWNTYQGTNTMVVFKRLGADLWGQSEEKKQLMKKGYFITKCDDPIMFDNTAIFIDLDKI